MTDMPAKPMSAEEFVAEWWRRTPMAAHSSADMLTALERRDADIRADERAKLLAELREPTPEMVNEGEFINSEWLNDNAPIGQRMYREPAKAVFLGMLAAFERSATTGTGE